MEPGESYTLRRKVLRLFGAAFHVYDREGRLVAYCEQKAFKLKEDIRLYADEARSREWLVIRARRRLDFAATYDVLTPDGAPLGSLRRRGLRSTFVRDSWLLFAPDGREIARLEEEGSPLLVLARRYLDLVSLVLPQRFVLRRADGAPVARFRQHFHLLVYRLGIALERPDPELDERMVIAAACLIGAIEGRQAGG
jgi:hypothetical protein